VPSIAGDEQLPRLLTLLVAVCEQSLVELEALSSPDPETTDLVEQLRARIYDLLDDPARFANRNANPSQASSPDSRSAQPGR
jgi:hypothetical protein